MMILLSSSPKARALMSQIGFRIDQDYRLANSASAELPAPDGVDASDPAALTAALAAAYVAGFDAGALDQSLVIAVVSAVVCDGELLAVSAPGGPSAAPDGPPQRAQILERVCGKRVDLVYAVCFARAEDRTQTHCERGTTQIWMRQYDAETLRRYLHREPPDGGPLPFNVDGLGVTLVKSIDGSCSSLSGLPIEALTRGLKSDLCAGRVRRPLSSLFQKPVREGDYPLRAVAIGDLSLDFVARLGDHGGADAPPRKQVVRQLGGDAALFAVTARREGFAQVDLLGNVGGDFIGQEIIQRLSRERIETQRVVRQPEADSGVVLTLLPEQGAPQHIIDASPALRAHDVASAEESIRAANVLYVSGRALCDRRRQTVVGALQLARRANVLTVVDLPDNYEQHCSLAQLQAGIADGVTILAASEATLAAWLGQPLATGPLPEALAKLCSALVLRRARAPWRLVTPDGAADTPYGSAADHQRDLATAQPLARLVYRLVAPRIVLASRSPRRVQLLTQIMAPGKFEVIPSDMDEGPRPPGEPVDTYLSQLALKKARAIRDRRRFSPYVQVIVGADTEIVLDDEPLGQPRTDEEARPILERLNGRAHQVKTGVAMIDVQTGREITTCVTTHVQMRHLSAEEIDSYIATREPIGKAGAYGIQGLAATLIAQITGSYSNVVGLPLEQVAELLHSEMGVPIWSLDAYNAWQL